MYIRAPISDELPIRFQAHALPGVWFLRYPASVEPEEGTVGFVTDGETWQAGGVYREGAWRRKDGQPFKREIRSWTIMEPRDG